MWAEGSPPPYSRDLPPLHTDCPGHVLLQIGLSVVDINGEYQGGIIEGNEGGDASVE